MSRRLSFVLASALLVVLVCATAGSALAAEKYTRGLRYPSLTPDKKTVVFAYRGDIWVADTDGKTPARRLTIHEAQDTLPRISPDGKSIVFSSQRNGAYDLFVIPVIGGEAKQISFHSGIEIAGDWSPDGKRILFVSNRDANKYRLNVYEMPAAGGPARRLTIDGGRDPSYTPDGKAIVYARGFNTIYQDDYEGSANYDLYTVPLSGGKTTRLTKSAQNERYPFVSKDGKTLYFVAEESKVANFYAMPLAGGKRRQVTKYTGNDVHRPDLSFDGTTVVFERWGQLFHTDLSSKEPKATQIKLVVRGDVRHSGVTKRTVTSGAEQACVSKDGSALVFALRGDIWATAGNGGPAKRLTSGPAKDEWPRWSPDGRRIAFQSDRSGNSNLFVMKADGSGIRQVTKDKAGDFFHAWSPSGTELVFCSERSGNRDIWKIDVESGDATQLTKHKAADDDPVFSPDGRLIAFDSGREGPQAIYVMDADGNNVRRVTNGGGQFLQVPSFSPDGSLICYEAFDVGTGRSGGLFVISAAGGPSMRISSDGSAACWSPRGDYIYFCAGRSGRQEIFRVAAPTSIENREKVPFMGTIEIDLRRELADLFDEAWNGLKNGFYDAKMHGVDWDAMRKKYRDMAVDAENKSEFQNVVMQMIAELNASHLGIHGGRKDSNTVSARVVPTGYLGAEFADGPGKSGGRKIVSVLPRSPADRAGLRVGDEVAAINRKKVTAKTDLDRLMAGTVGKEISIRYRPISETGQGAPRTAKLKPISAGTMRKMQYTQWMAKCVAHVAKATKGQIAYLHLNAMDQPNLARFQRAIGNWNRRSRVKGLILDVRENGGGNIHQQLMQVLTARPYAQVRSRRNPRATVTQPALYWDKPVVVLINERSFSDAEVFPYVFKSAGIGKVIGVPTPGGVIGTNDISLSDGSTFRIPHVGYYGMDGTNLERLGVEPDIHVEETTEDRVEGRDPQLERAIKEVMAEVKAGKRKPTQKRRPRTTPAGSKPKPPTNKPEKPTAKPTPTEPTPDKPDAPGGHGNQGSAMDPLADVRVGEWVRFKATLPGNGEQIIMKVQVTEVKDGTVFFDREVEEGPPLPLPMPTEAPQVPLLDGLKTMGNVVDHKTITDEVNGQRVEVAVVTIEAFGGHMKMYFTNAVPCMGLMKIEMGKVTVLEASEWGLEKSAASPEETTKPAAVPEKAPAKPETAPDEQPVPPQPRPRPPSGASKRPEGPSNPLYDAKVGEWVRLRSIVQGEETIATLVVTQVTEEEVRLESRVAYGGKEIRGAPVTRARRAHMTLGGRRGRGKVEVGSETLEVKGQSLDCITITRTSRRGQVDKRWLCNDVPVTGLVRQERGGKVVKELLDWGTGEPPSQPVQR